MAQAQTTAGSDSNEVREKHRFDVKNLERFMEEHVEGFRGPLTVSQFSGGQSCPTYKLEASSDTYVMRRKPPGKLLPSAHAVDREFRVMKGLNQTDFPVPHAYVLCDDTSIVGTQFYIMSYTPGRVMWDPSMPEVSRSDRTAIYDSVNETLAKLHSYDHVALGLEDHGRPGNYFARQIHRWSKQYKMSESETIEEMDRLMEWLPAHNPTSDETCIVHGDFAMHNIMIHATEPRVLAVLDWEISTLGHPLGDLTYTTQNWYTPAVEGGRPVLSGQDLEALGIPSLNEFHAKYCERAGRGPIENIHFYKSYNLFRSAAIAQGIMGRVRDGTANDPNAALNERRIRPLAKAAWEEAVLAGAT